MFFRGRLSVAGFGTLLLYWAVLWSAVRAEPPIRPVLESWSDYSFRLRVDLSPPLDTGSAGRFEATVLNEAVLHSYSVWLVSARGLDLFELRIYDMLDPSGAYSLFSLWPEIAGQSRGSFLDLPIDATFQPEAATFWRGNLFVELLPIGGSRLSREPAVQFIQAFYQQLQRGNLLPVCVAQLPQEDLIPESIRFYLGPGSLILNAGFPPALLGDIGFQDQIEICQARFQGIAGTFFLIAYPTPALAEAYSLTLQDRLGEWVSRQRIFLKRSGLLLGLFMGPELEAQTLLSRVRYDPEIRWVYRKDADLESAASEGDGIRNFLDLIRQTLLGIGLFMVLTIAAGCLMGVLRYEALRRFPAWFARHEMIRLNLTDQ